MIRRQEFALQHTKPDFYLIAPRGIGGGLHHRRRDRSVLRRDLWRQLLRGMRRLSIQDQHCAWRRLPTDRLRQQHRRQNVLEVHETLACRVLSDHPPLRHPPPGDQLPGAPLVGTQRLAQRRPGYRGVGRRDRFPRLGRGCFVTLPHPGTLHPHDAGAGVWRRTRASATWPGHDMLPHPIAPGVQALRTQPASDRAGQDQAIRIRGHNAPRRFGPTPAHRRPILLSWQLTGRGCHLRLRVRGKTPGCARPWCIIQGVGLHLASAPRLHDAIGGADCLGNRLVAPIGMVMGGQHDSGAHRIYVDLQRGAYADQLLQLLFAGSGYVNGRVGLCAAHT